MVFVGPVLSDARYFLWTGSRVFLYSFDYHNPAALASIVDAPLRGIPHGWELQYLFGEPATSNGGWPVTPDDLTVSAFMSTSWTNFVRSG